jgi:signal transduction histidine kinase/CheY-like chemotaxis protein/purine-cytosine permease-like protein
VNLETTPTPAPVQRVIKVRRDYNAWVASETLEDYALRFTARSSRRWSVAGVANTALGGAGAFLVLEAVGATLLVQHGFANALWAIVVTGLVIFLAGVPISVYAARHGVDMDLLTRGAGFGYMGSTLTSLIYASFTFIFFALEAAVMAYALDLAFDIPPAWGYLLCALVVVPLVTHGVAAISRLQVWTQPLWLVLLVLPYVYVFEANPGLLSQWASYGGVHGQAGFDALGFGTATTVGIALITQMGEQADYLRFMPEPGGGRRARLKWWAGVLVGGTGWLLPGVLKMLGGSLLAYLAIRQMVPTEQALDPNQLYLAAYQYVFPHFGAAVAATAALVILSQLKINVTNAYAGSLAWSNFFSRVTHSHPGRVVWVVFNIAIGLMLMELDVFQAMGGVLGLFSNIAISWIMAVVADLVVNKPLGWSPPGIEFKRAHLYDINPVGVGAMAIASGLSVAAHLGLFGAWPQAYSALIAAVTAFACAPLIAWGTGSRYYLTRVAPKAEGRRFAAPAADSEHGRYGMRRCCICEREYEGDDMAHCPAYQGPICSLCCTLDARCNDLCKPEARFSAQWAAALRRLLPMRAWPYLEKGLGHYVLLMLAVVPLLGMVFLVLYQQELRLLVARQGEVSAALLAGSLRMGFLKAYAALLLVSGVAVWWLVLAHKSRLVAQEESNRQTRALHEQTRSLEREIASHRRTDLALQAAKQQAEQAQQVAETANQAKSRYISTISHELRTPLNSILGYAQLLEDDARIPPNRRAAVSVIRRGGDHLLSLIEGTLDIARIESGKLALNMQPMRLREGVDELVAMFALQAADLGLAFRYEPEGTLPEWVRADEKRLRQILINILGNAVKFTRHGEVRLRVRHVREMARFEIEDTGPGMSEQELAQVFEPFARGAAAGGKSGGTGLGLTIAKMLADLMGGELTVRSTPGVGTCFSVRLFLPELHDEPARRAARNGRVQARAGYLGPRRRVLVVDNEEADRGFLVDALSPLGFEVLQASSGEACLALLADLRTQPAAAWPDVLFMDLAMPGIDGWETLRRVRAQGLSVPATAIVSANAFDKALENDVGIQPRDFLVKPVRVHELLDWLGERLSLEWTAPAAVEPSPAPPVAAPLAATDLVYPPTASLQGLLNAARSGYVRGIAAQLDQIERDHPACQAFVGRARSLTQQFRIDALRDLLQAAG